MALVFLLRHVNKGEVETANTVAAKDTLKPLPRITSSNIGQHNGMYEIRGCTYSPEDFEASFTLILLTPTGRWQLRLR